MREWRRFVPACLFAVGCLLTSGARPQRPAALAQPLTSLPDVVAGVRGQTRQISASEQSVAGMSNYVFRTFARDSATTFSVYVGYYESQTTGKTIHSPRNCLPGAGWQTLRSEPQSLDNRGRAVAVNRFLLANGSAQALVYYWYQGRGRIASNEYRVKWDLLRDAALHGRSEEALVRIIVPVVVERGSRAGEWGPAQMRADSLAHVVARELAPEVDRVLPAWGRGPLMSLEPSARGANAPRGAYIKSAPAD
jgi:EpsI family protein